MKKEKPFLWAMIGGIVAAFFIPIIGAAVQTYVLPTGSTGERTEMLTNGPNRDEAQRSSFSGTSAPSSPTPVAGQLWFNTTADTLNVRNAANSEWVKAWSAAACDSPSNFKRLNTTECIRDSSWGSDNPTETTSCTSKTTGLSLSADAKAIGVRLIWNAISSNAAVTMHSNVMFFYADSSCTKEVDASHYAVLEQTAVNNATLGQTNSYHKIPLVSTDTYYYKFSSAAASAAFVSNIQILEVFY